MCGQRPVACFPAVLLPCVISNTYHIDISRPDTLTATEPRKEPPLRCTHERRAVGASRSHGLSLKIAERLLRVTPSTTVGNGRHPSELPLP